MLRSSGATTAPSTRPSQPRRLAQPLVAAAVRHPAAPGRCTSRPLAGAAANASPATAARNDMAPTILRSGGFRGARIKIPGTDPSFNVAGGDLLQRAAA